jgi:hypothetical protein
MSGASCGVMSVSVSVSECECECDETLRVMHSVGQRCTGHNQECMGRLPCISWCERALVSIHLLHTNPQFRTPEGS